MEQSLTTQKVSRRNRWSWYFYDFGNSAYAAVVLLAVYSSYFKNAVVGGAEGTRLWGISIGIAAVVVALISPVLGSIADFSKAKKKFLFIFTSIAIVFTALLFFVQKGDIIETFANIDSLIKDFNYKPETLFTEGIQQFVDWYKSYFNI